MESSMNKPLLGLLLGTVLGALDGLSALASAPEVAPQIVSIVIGSTVKGLIAGLLIGWFARKVNSLQLGILVGLGVGALLALPIALSKDPVSGKMYFWEIMIPGAIVGLIVGFATQRYGRPAVTAGRA
jgi:predicted lipid-binding transport protein (Tim44 family)